MKIRNSIGILSVLIVIILFTGPAAAADTPSADSATQFYNSGVTLLNTGDYSNATLAFDSALAGNTTLIRMSDTLQYVYEDKAYALIQLKRYNDALATSQEGILIIPTDKKLWNNKGYASYNLGQYQDALTSYNQAISLDQNYTTALINKGDTQYKLGQFQDSVDSYTKALETDPGNADATAGLEHAKQAVPLFSPVILILIVVILVAVGGVVWYVKFRKPEGKKPAAKKTKTTKK